MLAACHQSGTAQASAARMPSDAAMPLDFADALTLEADTQRELGRAHDFGEGVAAFLAKRAPRFKDR